MKSSNVLFKLIHRIILESQKFQSIKQNPEKRATYKGYGVQSIIFTILGVAFSFSIFLLNIVTESNNILFILFLGLIFIVIAIIAPVLFLLNALLYSIMQIILNKKAIGFIALMLALIGLIPVVLLYISQFS